MFDKNHTLLSDIELDQDQNLVCSGLREPQMFICEQDPLIAHI